MEYINQRISIDIVGLAGACSYALDCIESELVSIKVQARKKGSIFERVYGRVFRTVRG